MSHECELATETSKAYPPAESWQEGLTHQAGSLAGRGCHINVVSVAEGIFHTSCELRRTTGLTVRSRKEIP